MKKPVILIILLIAYALLVPVCIIPFFSSYYTNIINPIIWLLLFLFAYFGLDKLYVRNKQKKVYTKLAIVLILFYFIIYFLSGFIFGFASSIYSHKIIMILRNIIAFVMVVIFQEYIRIKLVNRNSKTLFLIFITLLFTFIDLNTLSMPNSSIEIFKFLFSNVFPILILNIFCTYLAYIKTYDGIIFKAMPILVQLLIPIIPNLDWFYRTLFEVISYFIFYIIIRYQYSVIRKEKTAKENNPLNKVPFLIVLGFFILFIIGVFPYVPISIASNSMYNTIERGDAIIYSKHYNELKEEDIIVFAMEQRIIVHRIYRVQNDGTYITKGDNNQTVDNWIVREEDIIGVVKFRIPYLGYPAVKLSELFD